MKFVTQNRLPIEEWGADGVPWRDGTKVPLASHGRSEGARMQGHSASRRGELSGNGSRTWPDDAGRRSKSRPAGLNQPNLNRKIRVLLLGLLISILSNCSLLQPLTPEQPDKEQSPSRVPHAPALFVRAYLTTTSPAAYMIDGFTSKACDSFLKTVATDGQADDKGLMVLGFATHSYNLTESSSCSSNTLAMIMAQNNSLTDQYKIQWSQWFDLNGKYAAAEHIQFGMVEDGYSGLASTKVIFALLLARDSNANNDMLIALDATTGSYIQRNVWLPKMFKRGQGFMKHKHSFLFYKSESAASADEATSYTMLAWGGETKAAVNTYHFGPIKYKFKLAMAAGEVAYDFRVGSFSYIKNNLSPIFKYQDRLFVATLHNSNSKLCPSIATINVTTMENTHAYAASDYCSHNWNIGSDITLDSQQLFMYAAYNKPKAWTTYGYSDNAVRVWLIKWKTDNTPLDGCTAGTADALQIQIRMSAQKTWFPMGLSAVNGLVKMMMRDQNTESSYLDIIEVSDSTILSSLSCNSIVADSLSVKTHDLYCETGDSKCFIYGSHRPSLTSSDFLFYGYSKKVNGTKLNSNYKNGLTVLSSDTSQHQSSNDYTALSEISPYQNMASLDLATNSYTKDNYTQTEILGDSSSYEVIPCNSYTQVIPYQPLCSWIENWYEKCRVTRFYNETTETQQFTFPGLVKNQADASRSDCDITQYKIKFNDTDGVFQDWTTDTYLADPAITADGATGNFTFTFSATNNPAILIEDWYQIFLFAVDPQTGVEFNYFNSSTASIIFNWRCQDYTIETNQTAVSFVDRPEVGGSKTIQWDYLTGSSLLPKLTPSKTDCTRFSFSTYTNSNLTTQYWNGGAVAFNYNHNAATKPANATLAYSLETPFDFTLYVKPVEHQTVVATAVRFNIKVCGDETISVENGPLVISQDPSQGTMTINWLYTVPSTDTAYTSLPFKPPVWASTDSDCNINAISVFSDSELATAFVADPTKEISALTIDNAVYPPQMTLTFKTDTAFSQSLHFLGSSGLKNATTEVYIVICGNEQFNSSKDAFLVLDQIQVDGTSASFNWEVTSLLSGLANQAWTALSESERPPTFDSDLRGCNITSILPFEDDQLSNQYTPSGNIESITYDSTGVITPKTQVTYKRETAFEKVIYFKGYNAHTHASTAITFRVCDLPVSKKEFQIFNSISAATEEEVAWITVASDGADDTAYQALALSQRLPTFESAVSTCKLEQLQYYTDSALTQPLSSSHPFQVATDTTATGSHPAAKITYSRDQMFTSEVYVKGSVNGSASNSTKIVVTVCGDETLTATEGKSPHFLINQSETDDPTGTSFYRDLNISVFEEFFTLTHPDGFNAHCGLFVSLWEDSDCSATKLDKSENNIDNKVVQPYLTEADSSGNRKIRVQSASYMKNTTLYLRGDTYGLKKVCIPLTFKIQCGALAFEGINKQPVVETYNQQTGTKFIDLSKDAFKVSNINDGCPVDSDDGYALVEFSKATFAAQKSLPPQEQKYLFDEGLKLSISKYVFMTGSSGKYKININTDTMPVGKYTFWLRVVQEKENMAHLQFDLTILEPIEAPVFTVPIEEEEEEVVVPPPPPIPEPEPEPEPKDAHAEEEEEEEETEESAEWKPQWQVEKKKSKADVSAFLSASQVVVLPPEEKPPPFGLSPCKATRDGKFRTCFNQPCIPPPFEEFQNTTGRGLLKMSEVDVTRDIVDLKFSLNSDVNVSDIKYTLDITNWTEDYFEIFINYTNPLLISQGQSRDFVSLNIKDPTWFRSAATGEVIDLSLDQNQNIAKTIPRQLPKGIIAEEVEAQAESTKQVMTAIMIVQIVLSGFLKGAIDDVWGMFLICQMIAYMSIYDTSIPANVEIYVGEFRKMVKFEILKPDPILGMIQPGLTVQSLIEGAKGGKKEKMSGSLESSGQTDSFLMNMITYVIALLLFSVFMFVLFLLYRIQKLRAKIMEKIEGIKKKTFWNNTVRSVSITYLETAIQMSVQIQLLKSFDPQKVGTIVATGAFLVAYPSLCLYYLMKHWEDLDTPLRRGKAEKMYQDISLRRGKLAVLYYPMFIFRRLVFVLIPLALKAHPYMQLQFLVFFSSLYIIWYSQIWPHSSKKLIRLEIFNEAMFMALNYHMVTFTQFVTQVEAQFFMGYSYLATVVLLILVNLSIAVQNTIRKVKTKSRAKKMQKQLQERLKVQKEEMQKKIKQMAKQKKIDEAKEKERFKRAQELKKQKVELTRKEQRRVDFEIDQLITNTLNPKKNAKKQKPVNKVLSVIEEDEHELFEDKELEKLLCRKEAFNLFLDKQVDLFYDQLTPKEIDGLQSKIKANKVAGGTPQNDIFQILDQKQYNQFKQEVDSRIERLSRLEKAPKEQQTQRFGLSDAQLQKHDPAELKVVNDFLDHHLDELLEGHNLDELQNNPEKIKDLLNNLLNKK